MGILNELSALYSDGYKPLGVDKKTNLGYIFDGKGLAPDPDTYEDAGTLGRAFGSVCALVDISQNMKWSRGRWKEYKDLSRQIKEFKRNGGTGGEDVPATLAKFEQTRNVWGIVRGSAMAYVIWKEFRENTKNSRTYLKKSTRGAFAHLEKARSAASSARRRPPARAAHTDDVELQTAVLLTLCANPSNPVAAVAASVNTGAASLGSALGSISLGSVLLPAATIAAAFAVAVIGYKTLKRRDAKRESVAVGQEKAAKLADCGVEKSKHSNDKLQQGAPMSPPRASRAGETSHPQKGVANGGNRGGSHRSDKGEAMKQDANVSIETMEQVKAAITQYTEEVEDAINNLKRALSDAQESWDDANFDHVDEIIGDELGKFDAEPFDSANEYISQKIQAIEDYQQ